MSAAVEVVLEDGPQSVPRARGVLRDALDAHRADLYDDAALVVTELVTNALLHGGAPVLLRVLPLVDGVRLEVADQGPELPVRLQESTDAMTGRGLSLVATVARRWGVEPEAGGGKAVWAEVAGGAAELGQPAELDVDALLAAFRDDDDAQDLFRVELGAVPTDLLLDAKAHIDNLVREFTLESASAADAVVPSDLAELVSTVVHGFAQARSAIKRQAVAAARRGDREVRLTLTLPASATKAGEDYLLALEKADGWAREARLLTLETPPVHKLFRHWYVQTLVDQLRAAAAGTAAPTAITFLQRVTSVLAEQEVRSALGVDHAALFRALPTPYLVMDPDLVIVECNDAYLANVGRTRAELLGTPVFEAFPPTADALDDTGVSRIQRSFERARDTGRSDTMPVQRYAIPDGAGGFIERFWSLISVPVLDADGRVIQIAQRAENITDFVAERERDSAERARTEELGRRVVEVETDLYARSRELEAALAAKEKAAERVAILGGVALDLTQAQTADDLARVVISTGLPVLGADGGAVSVRHDREGVVRLAVGDQLGEHVQLLYGELPLDSPLPAASVARTGQTVLLPTRASGLTWSPLMDEVYAATQRLAWAALPLRVGDELLGALVASWIEEREFSADDVALLEGFAAQVSQALQRIQATDAQRATALASQRMSETLQRSLLTEPPCVPGLEIAVRYQPAAQEAQIGGDWYDAFLTTDGSTLVVIGDVGGHDRTAAAMMGQVRNLLRGMAYDTADSPAVLLSRLDTAMQGLGMERLATALLGRVEVGHGNALRLRWSNGGHLPPVLRSPDGDVRVLGEESDLLLGLDAATTRTEHVTELPVGSTVVLFTDGLVERRAFGLDVGVQRVLDAVQALEEPDAEQTADAVVTAADGSNEDDIAVLVLRVT